MLQLYFKRAKIFLDIHDGKEHRFQGNPAAEPVVSPDWVQNTLTFKLGIADKSIIDLTPPKRANAKKSAAEPATEVGESFDPTNIGKNAADPKFLESITEARELVGVAAAAENKPAFGGVPAPTLPKGMPQRRGGRVA